MSVVPETGPHATPNWSVVSYAGSVVTAESGGVRSTIVPDWFPDGVGWTFPAWSVPIERNSYVWRSAAPVNSCDVWVTETVIQSSQGPPLSRNWILYVATSSDSRPHVIMKLDVDCHIGSGRVEVNGACVSTVVHVSFVAGGISTFPA